MLGEEKQPNETAKEGLDETANLVQALNDLKANSVSREDYEKLNSLNQQLVQSIVNGQGVKKEEVKEQVDISKLRKELFSSNTELSNVAFVEKSLKLRNAMIENGEGDPFVPHGNKIVPTEEDYATAQRVADVLQECVEYAKGDNDVFTNELQRRTIDVGPNRR